MMYVMIGMIFISFICGVIYGAMLGYAMHKAKVARAIREYKHRNGYRNE